MQRPSHAKQRSGCSHFYDFQPAILRTSKRINSEARRFLYNDNLFVLVRYSHALRGIFDVLRTPNLTILAAKEDEVHCFRSALRISLHVDLCNQGKEDLGVESQFVIAANELLLFCKILRQLNNETPGFLSALNLVLGVFPSYQLHVGVSEDTGPSGQTIWSPRSLPQQRRLLEPFATLHSMLEFNIADVHAKTERLDARLMQDVKKRATQFPSSTEENLVTVAQIKEQGNEAFRTGDFVVAKQLYESAMQTMRGYLTTATQEGKITARTTRINSRAHYKAAFPIRSNSIAALLGLQQWMAAHKEANELIEHLKSLEDTRMDVRFDFGQEIKIYYRRALASEGMGKMAQAVEEIREALRLDPNNTRLKAKLREWKMQEDSAKPARVKAALKALTM